MCEKSLSKFSNVGARERRHLRKWVRVCDTRPTGAPAPIRRPLEAGLKLCAKIREQLLARYESLRVADVRDGMDWCGMHHYGSLRPDIRPLFRTRACGIMRVAAAEYTVWSGWYYAEVCTYRWMDEIQAGDFIVIDQSGVDVRLMGSHNALVGVQRGARGYVTSGGVRDTDELIRQQIPFWSRFVSQGMVQGRLRFDAHNVPVACGGVTVHPGDVVVADGDGVIVVPRGKAQEVAAYAQAVIEGDKAGRRGLYKQLGLPEDDSVR
jgi:4-hydroxy-4-methyl-2-oxoglutarate aldolase